MRRLYYFRGAASSDKMVVLYDADGKGVADVANAFVEKGIENTYVVAGGFHGNAHMRCAAMRCDALRCAALRCDAMRCYAMRCYATLGIASRCPHVLSSAPPMALAPVPAASVQAGLLHGRGGGGPRASPMSPAPHGTLPRCGTASSVGGRTQDTELGSPVGHGRAAPGK